MCVCVCVCGVVVVGGGVKQREIKKKCRDYYVFVKWCSLIG